MIEKTNLPKGWEVKKLGEVLKISSGKGLKINSLKGGLHPVYGGNGINGYHSEYNTENPKLIIGRVGVKCGVTYVTKPKSWVTDNALIVEPIIKDFDIHFFKLKLEYENLNKLSVSTAQPVISGSKIYAYEILLPPLFEQTAIVAKIEELLSDLENGKQQLLTAQAQLKVYRQSLLKWAFEGKLTNKNVKEGELPEGWKWGKLKEIANDISDGDHQAPPKSENGICFITISNINKQSSKIDFENTFKVNTEYYHNLKINRKPQKGDVLYTVTGSFGIPILIDYEKEFCFQRHIGLVRPLKAINQKWVYYLLQSPQVFNQAKATATGTAQKTVALSSLRGFNIPICSLIEQNRIVEELESKLTICDKIEETISQSLLQSETLRQSILKKAFEGKLV